MTRYSTAHSNNIMSEYGHESRGPAIFARFGTTLLAKLLGGEVAGVKSVVVPGPGRSLDDRSLLIKEDMDDKDGFAVHSFVNDDQHICRELVFAVTEASTYRSTGSEAYGSLSAASSRANQPALKRAMELWSETASPEGTLVEYYLRKRGLKLPADSVGSISNDSIRFHPACPFGPYELHPCMVGLYRHINTDMPTGILLTALSEKGDKIGRKALGPGFFRAIKLTRSYVSDGSLVIAESLESALAGMSQSKCPAWCVGGAKDMRRLEVLDGVTKLIIFAGGAEDSISGLDAKECLHHHWKYSNAEMHHVIPNYLGHNGANVLSDGTA